MSRILIFAEAVTLAHVARPIALSRILRELGHEVCIAAAPAADRWLADEDVARERIESIASSTFLRALTRGLPPYDGATLKRYVEDDLRAIASWKPDIVVGDFRLSLYISARLAGKPYGAIANAYWSRRYWNGVDAPDISALSWLPRPLADAVFRVVYPTAFALHALPFHRTCKRFGVKSPGLDIRDVYTASDCTAFADVESFYEPWPGTGASAAHHADAPLFIGPLAWEPPDVTPMPVFPDGPPIVFVSLGSSSPAGMLPRVLEALVPLPVRMVVATGREAPVAQLPANCILAAEFVPYAAACAIAALVVCNGGAPAIYAALRRARPVMGLASNLDQLLNMRNLRRLGLAATPANSRAVPLGQSIANLMRDAHVHRAADAASRGIAASGATPVVARWLSELR